MVQKRDEIAEAFQKVATGEWIEGDCESISGPGSTLSFTEKFRR